MDDNYKGLRYYNEYYSGENGYEKAIEIVSGFDYSSLNQSVNAVFELQTAGKIIASKGFEDRYGKETTEKHKVICRSILPYIAKWFSQFTDEMFLASIDLIYTGYFESFLACFSKFKVYERISDTAFSKCLKLSDTVLYAVLRCQHLVAHYDTIIAEYMRNSSQTIHILVKVFLEEGKEKYYLPKSLMPAEFETIFQKYIESDCINPNLLQLIFDAKSRPECPISNNVKLAARKRYTDFWNAPSILAASGGYGVRVLFSDVKETKMNMANKTVELTYNAKWLNENLDYPTILNNFIYVFELFNLYFNPQFVPVSSKISALESVYMVNGKDWLKKGNQFVISNAIASSQITLYHQLLQEKGIELESVFQWFFEEYLRDEFGADGFSFTPPSKGVSCLERIRNIASEMDAVLKQYDMFVKEGRIDRELFEMSSEHIVFANINSQLQNKYGYLNDVDSNTAAFYLFSDQSVLSYTEKTEAKYLTFWDLMRNEEMKKNDFNDYQKELIDCLVFGEYLFVDSTGKLSLNIRKTSILKSYYDNDVLCLKYLKGIEKYFNSIRITNTLFSEPEQKYLNYMLNKSVYSDGRDLRNSYIHGTNPKIEEIQERDYVEFLKIMILIIVKINEEFCLKDVEERGER